MGSKAREIVNVDIEKLLKMLNKALGDEWLATYQYWIGAQVAVGSMRPNVESEFLIHAKEEQVHAQKVVDRIVQLGGTPVLNPKEWFTNSPDVYLEPKDFNVKALLKQNITGEQMAITDYNRILDMVSGKDHITYYVVSSILADEIEHEEDLQTLLDDINKSHK